MPQTASSDPVVVLVNGLLHDIVFLHLVRPLILVVLGLSIVGLLLVLLSDLHGGHLSAHILLVSALSVHHEVVLLDAKGVGLLPLEGSNLILFSSIELLGLVLVPLGDGHSLLLVSEERTPSVFVNLVHLPLLMCELGALLALLHLPHGVVLVSDILFDGPVEDVSLVALHYQIN